jgi:hypothetical protein
MGDPQVQFGGRGHRSQSMLPTLMLTGLRQIDAGSPDAEGLGGLGGAEPPCDFNSRILAASIGCPVFVDAAFALAIPSS